MSTPSTIRIPLTIPSSISSTTNAYVQISVENDKCEVFQPDARFQLGELQSTDDAQVKLAILPRTSVRIFPDSTQPVTLKVRRADPTAFSACLFLIH
jgi:hypothetical protein